MSRSITPPSFGWFRFLCAPMLLSAQMALILPVICAMLLGSPAQAHEQFAPTGEFSVSENQLNLRISIDLQHVITTYSTPSYVVPNGSEGGLSGLGLPDNGFTSGDVTPFAQPEPALSSAEMITQMRALWPQMQAELQIVVDGKAITPELSGLYVPPPSPGADARVSIVQITADLPTDAKELTLGWPTGLGALLLLQTGVETPFNGVVQNGELSAPILIEGSGRFAWVTTFSNYVWLGFEHIIPKGTDHICFVLGLFFFSMAMRPLILQVTSFTIGHSLSLAAGMLGLITVPASIVEPLIAASIVFVGIENIVSKGVSPWRPWIVLGFGLIHGLGFASVLGELGMSTGRFFTSLIGFNLGVEFGQLTVIAIAFLTVGYWFGHKPWYRARIAIPASVLISAFGAFWLLQRTVLG